MNNAYFGRYVPSNGATGHLLYGQEGALVAVAFDPERLVVLGAPTPVLPGVASASLGAIRMAFSNTGTLAYGAYAEGRWTMTWLDREGNHQPLYSTPGAYRTPAVSPDRKRLAFVMGGRGLNVHIYDFGRATTTPLTFSGDAELPVWTPDSQHLVYSTRPAAGGSTLMWARADGAGAPIKLQESAYVMAPFSVLQEGQFLLLAYTTQTSRGNADILVLPLDVSDPSRPVPHKPQPFLTGPDGNFGPQISPDGRWIAHEGGGREGGGRLWVRPFEAGKPAGEIRWPVSDAPGFNLQWSRVANQLFYLTREPRNLMVVDYRVDGDSFLPGPPRKWTDGTFFITNGTQPQVSLHPDGNRFAVLRNPVVEAGNNTLHLTFLLNFFDELRRLAPETR